MKRGNFVLGTISGLAVSANTNHVFARALAAAPLPGLPGGQNRCLVLVNLQGGNDGLNCVVPHGDGRYYQLRPTLA
ncbi:MAG: Twin-arginine translocation pathway signal sequence domain-containing protein, partial [Candidatus Eremiobacteraeota bacterium]|nr:Twin-arginine translocation pathway signal sequence domain-containing protein [Candidatus Eremiobacteraeota bacterium]